MLILLWGLPSEDPLAIVRRELEHLGAEVAFLDQTAVLETRVDLDIDDAARAWVTVGDHRLDLDAVSAAYARPYDSCRVARVAATPMRSAERRHAASVDELLWAWCDLADCLVVNRPRNMTSNDSKPYQLEILDQYGFLTPATLVTTDPAAVRTFWAEHGTVVYKSVSGIRSVVSRLQPEHSPRLADVTHCPTQFQAYIPGVDVRAHIVGTDVLACELVCDADDYRYRGERAIDVRPYTLPPDVAQRCVAAARGLGLSVAGVDLRRTPDGEWFCFEVNPMPGFSYFEYASGLPIGAAIARLLLNARADESARVLVGVTE